MALSEFDIIEQYFAPLGDFKGPYTRLGPGDDCAVITPPAGEQLCVSTDTFIEGIHFPQEVDPAIVAQRSLAAALSDLAAMGSKPVGVTGAITLPGVAPAWLSAFSQTLKACLARWQSPLIGGNISQGRVLSITWTVLGSVPFEEFISRCGASAGADIYVSGWPGRAGLALAQRLNGETATKTLAPHYEAPQPRLELGQNLRGIASAMIDVSDGLLADLQHLLDASGLGAELDLATLSFDTILAEAAISEVAARRMTLTAGDDYELCFTADSEHRAAIGRLADVLGLPLTRIGKTQTQAGIRFLNRPEDLSVDELSSQQGYQHFV